MPFPQTRLRRLRATRALRGLVRETRLAPADFVYPMFVAHGIDRREPIAAMPGIDRLSIAHAVSEAGEALALGIPGVLLFGIPAAKDEAGSGAWDDEGIVQLATQEFTDYIKFYPDTDLAGNADFYLAEIEYKAGDYQKAVANYDLVLQNFPSGNKAAAAQLKKGFALIELGKQQEGAQEL